MITPKSNAPGCLSQTFSVQKDLTAAAALNTATPRDKKHHAPF
jgi:hypothetical protein